jgi:hypothetical protein
MIGAYRELNLKLGEPGVSRRVSHRMVELLRDNKE